MIGAAVRVAYHGAVGVVLPHTENDYRPYALSHPVLSFLNAFLLAIALGTSLTISVTPEVARLSSITTPTIVRLTNDARVRAGLPPLKETPALQRSALLKAQHMIQHDYFEHVSPDGLSPWVWFERANYNYTYAGENLAIDFTEAEDVVTAWLRSPGHRRNLLSNRYADTGMAVVTGEFKGRTATIVVQHFGSLGATTVRAAALPPAPRVAELQTTALPVLELAPPTITLPLEGALLGRGTITVRGSAPIGSSVDVFLDGVVSGTFAAPNGSFVGTFLGPENEERASELTARAIRDGRTSVLSAPRQVTLDTQAPQFTADRTILLPDPQGQPSTVLLAVPASSDVARATFTTPGRDPIPLTRRADVLFARLALADLRPRGLTPTLAGGGDHATLLIADAHGNSRIVAPQTLLPYVTVNRPETAPRARVAAAVLYVRPWIAGALTLLTALLAVNVLVHLRMHRLMHADILAHALVVVGLGTTLVLLT